MCETFHFHLTHFSWNINILHHALFLYNCPWFFYKWNIFYAGLHHTFFLKIKLLSSCIVSRDYQRSIYSVHNPLIFISSDQGAGLEKQERRNESEKSFLRENTGRLNESTLSDLQHSLRLPILRMLFSNILQRILLIVVLFCGTMRGLGFKSNLYILREYINRPSPFSI